MSEESKDEAVPQKFCVIGECAGGGINNERRTFYPTAVEAVDYAKSIARKAHAANPNKPISLFVVQVAYVVTTNEPQINVREPNAFD